MCVCVQSLQSCLNLCDLVDYSLPGSSVHGVLQARTLEWVAVPASRGSSWPRDRTCILCVSCTAGGLFTTEPPGKPMLRVLWLLSSHSLMSDFWWPWTAACQASLSFTISQSLLKLISIELVMPSNRVILCHILFCPQSFSAYGLFQWIGSSHQVVKELKF